MQLTFFLFSSLSSVVVGLTESVENHILKQSLQCVMCDSTSEEYSSYSSEMEETTDENASSHGKSLHG